MIQPARAGEQQRAKQPSDRSAGEGQRGVAAQRVQAAPHSDCRMVARRRLSEEHVDEKRDQDHCASLLPGRLRHWGMRNF